jgi:hypothetical protein
MRPKTSMKSIAGPLSIAIGTLNLVASPAVASTIAIPEPSALSIYALAAAGVVIAARFLRRK